MERGDQLSTHSSRVTSREGNNTLTVGVTFNEAVGQSIVRSFLAIENRVSDDHYRTEKEGDWPESELLYFALACKHVVERDSTTIRLGYESTGFIDTISSLEAEVAGVHLYVSSHKSSRTGTFNVIEAYCPRNEEFSHWHLVFERDSFARFAEDLLAVGLLVEAQWKRAGLSADGPVE